MMPEKKKVTVRFGYVDSVAIAAKVPQQVTEDPLGCHSGITQQLGIHKRPRESHQV